MWRWLLFSLTLSLAIPAGAQRRAAEPTPALRIDLRPYGYRTEGVALEYTQLLFLSDKQLAIKLHQEVPNHAPSEACKRFLARLGKYASFPDCQHVALPIRVLILEVETGMLQKDANMRTEGRTHCAEETPGTGKPSRPSTRRIEKRETYKLWTRVRHFPLEDFGKLPPDVRIVRVREVRTGAKRFELRTEHYPGNPDAVLSPDGRRVALIQNGFLEIYLLPPTTTPPPTSSPVP